jgi:hypothetical protein
MVGALNLKTPQDLFAKLEHEISNLNRNQMDSYAALNAVRDAYHLREWIWKARLDADTQLQTQIMGRSGSESDWNTWVNQQFPNFPVLRELCNGSKHFALRSPNQITTTHEAGWDHQLWDTLPWDAEGFYVKLSNGSVLSVTEILDDTRLFWDDLMVAHSI